MPSIMPIDMTSAADDMWLMLLIMSGYRCFVSDGIENAVKVR